MQDLKIKVFIYRLHPAITSLCFCMCGLCVNINLYIFFGTKKATDFVAIVEKAILLPEPKLNGMCMHLSVVKYSFKNYLEISGSGCFDIIIV